MQKLLTLFIFVCTGFAAQAQELYVNTEPAINMAANSLGIRLSDKFFNMKHESGTGMRFEPEVMFGFSKKADGACARLCLQQHAKGYAF